MSGLSVLEWQASCGDGGDSLSRRIALGIFVMSLAVCTDVSALEMGVGLRAGTQGFGLEYGIQVTRWVGVRGAGYLLDYSADFDDDGNSYEGTLTLSSYGAFVDIYPTGKTFRISAGVLANGNRIEANGRPTENQEIGGTDYTPAQIGELSGDVEFDDTAGYVGIGAGRFTGADRLGFLFDVGTLIQGSGDVSIRTSAGQVAPADIKREEADREDDIENYKYWPVISFGLAVRF